jgi:hypothetical protein
LARQFGKKAYKPKPEAAPLILSRDYMMPHTSQKKTDQTILIDVPETGQKLHLR